MNLPLSFRAVRASLALAAHVAPTPVGKYYAVKFMTPTRGRYEASFLMRADLQDIEDGCRFWEFGSGPAVLLIHGWQGRPAQFEKLVSALVTNGYKAIIWELPAHGNSAEKRTNLNAIANRLAKFAQNRGTFAGVIAHSLGGAAAQIALTRGLKASCLIRIAAPYSVPEMFRRFTEFMQLPRGAASAFTRHLETTAGVEAKSLGRAPTQVPTLAMHARDDRQVPFSEAAAFAKDHPDSELLCFERLGHSRILIDEHAISRALDYLGAHARG